MRHLVSVLALLTAGTITVAHGEPVGMASHITGRPQIKSGGVWQNLRLLQRVESGQMLRCAAGAEAVIVFFNSGRRFRIGPGGQGMIGSSGVAGGRAMGGFRAPSSAAARALGGARVGAVMARPATSHERLTPQAPGWLTPEADGSCRFTWTPVQHAAMYSFSLLDHDDDIAWSERVGADKTESIARFAPSTYGVASLLYDNDLAPAAAQRSRLQMRRPYVWRLIALGKSGKPLPGLRWGVVTFLNAADADVLRQAAAPLEQQAKENAADATAPALLSELYRAYGVFDKVLDKLDEIELLKEPGISEAISDAYRQISPYAYGQWLVIQADKQP